MGASKSVLAKPGPAGGEDALAKELAGLQAAQGTDVEVGLHILVVQVD